MHPALGKLDHLVGATERKIPIGIQSLLRNHDRQIERRPDGMWGRRRQYNGRFIVTHARNVGLVRREWVRIAREKSAAPEQAGPTCPNHFRTSPHYQIVAGWIPTSNAAANAGSRFLKRNAVNPARVALRWIDAYRSRSVEKLVRLYDTDATHICACGGQTLVAGEAALRAYWSDRLDNYPINEIVELKLLDETAASLRYIAGENLVQANLMLDTVGAIAHVIFGPLT